jgi:hypothetical protein
MKMWGRLASAKEHPSTHQAQQLLGWKLGVRCVAFKVA